MSWILTFCHDESGVTAVEYAVMLALIIIVCISIIGQIGTSTQNLMDPSGQLSNALRSGS